MNSRDVDFWIYLVKFENGDDSEILTLKQYRVCEFPQMILVKTEIESRSGRPKSKRERDEKKDLVSKRR